MGSQTPRSPAAPRHSGAPDIAFDHEKSLGTFGTYQFRRSIPCPHAPLPTLTDTLTGIAARLAVNRRLAHPSFQGLSPLPLRQLAWRTPILIDTSVWLRFLRGEEAGLVAQPLITSGQALVHPFVVGEFLLGGLSAGNEALLHALPWCGPAAPEELYEFIRSHRLTGAGIGWVDTALLAAARTAGAQLATYDTPLARCARQLDIGTPLPLPAASSSPPNATGMVAA